MQSRQSVRSEVKNKLGRKSMLDFVGFHRRSLFNDVVFSGVTLGGKTLFDEAMPMLWGKVQS